MAGYSLFIFFVILGNLWRRISLIIRYRIV